MELITLGLWDTMYTNTPTLIRKHPMKALIVVTETFQKASWFIDGIGNRDFFLSYGKAVPDTTGYELTSYWMAGAYAARLQEVGLAGNLTACGQSWLAELDISLTGRRIGIGELSEIPGDTVLWAKPAEAKIDAMVSGKYTKDEIVSICKAEDVPSDTLFQWTSDILKINHEHRFFIRHGKIMTGSPYLIDGEIYYPSITSPRYAEAEKAAEEILHELGDNQAPAYTLDVGLDELTNRWIIIEANPAWSSGLYGSDPAKVIETLEVACNSTEEKWKWIPSPYLVKKAKEKNAVMITDEHDTSGIWKYEKY